MTSVCRVPLTLDKLPFFRSERVHIGLFFIGSIPPVSLHKQRRPEMLYELVASAELLHPALHYLICSLCSACIYLRENCT